jgi:hypothetical protein
MPDGYYLDARRSVCNVEGPAGSSSISEITCGEECEDQISWRARWDLNPRPPAFI